MHLLVYTGQASWRLCEKFFSRVSVLYNLNYSMIGTKTQALWHYKTAAKGSSIKSLEVNKHFAPGSNKVRKIFFSIKVTVKVIR